MAEGNNDNKKRKLAANIILLRRKKGMTQQELADKSGVSRRTIQNIEADTASPGFEIVNKLLQALDHTIDFIENDE